MPRACDNCYIKKRKCSDNVPCKSCVDLDIPCEFTRPPKKTGRPYIKLTEQERKRALNNRRRNSIQTDDEVEHILSTDSCSSAAPWNPEVQDLICVPPRAPSASSCALDILQFIDFTNFENWKHHDFLNLKLPFSNGSFTNWIDLYYLNTYAIFPVIPRVIMEQYYFDIPIETIRLLFSTVYYINPRSRDLTAYYKQFCLRWYNEHKAAETIFDLLNLSAIWGFSFTLSQPGLSILCLDKLCREALRLYHHPNQSSIFEPDLDRKLLKRMLILCFVIDFDQSLLNQNPFSLNHIPADVLQDYKFSEEIETMDKSHIDRFDVLVRIMQMGKRILFNGKKYSSLVALKELYDSFPVLNALTPAEIVPAPSSAVTDTIIVMYFRFIEMITLLPDMLVVSSLEQVSVSIYTDMFNIASNVTELVQGVLMHESIITLVPPSFVLHVYLAGLILCFLSISNPVYLQNIDDHLTIVQILSKRFASPFWRYEDNLNRCILKPSESLRYLLEIQLY